MQTDGERMLRQLDTAAQTIFPLTRPITVVEGPFRLRSPNAIQVDRAIELILGELMETEQGGLTLEIAEARISLSKSLHRALDASIAESTFSFNLFNTTRPASYQTRHAEAHRLLAWGVGFNSGPPNSETGRASQDTLKEFEQLRSDSDCLAFSTNWGRLGPISENLYFKLVPQEAVRLANIKEALTISGLWPETWQFPTDSFQIPLTGEPLDAWLWHAQRLRTWRTLLRPVQSSRAVARLIDEIEKYTDVFPDPRYADVSENQWAAPSAATKYKTVTETEMLSREVLPWSYALHQEGGEFYFAGREFAELSRAVTSVTDNPRGVTKLESAIKEMITTLLRRTLAGHIHIIPRIGIEDREVIQADSLLAWLYLEFARQFAFRLGSAQVYVECTVCGTKVPESPHARGRRLYCGPNCNKEVQRHGLEEARRRSRSL